MKASWRPYPGNTLSEYSLLISLVLLAAFGSLFLLGHTLSGSLGGFAQGLKKDKPSMMAAGIPNGQALSGQGIGSNGGSASGGTAIPQAQAKAVSLPMDNLSASGGGKNITASDGKVDYAVNTTINASRGLLALANSLGPDSLLYGTLSGASKNAFMLGGNEASFSQKMNGVTGLEAITQPGLTGAETLRNVHDNYVVLSQILNQLKAYPSDPTATPQEKAVASSAAGMIQQSITAMWNTYSELKDYSYGSANGVDNIYLDTTKLEAAAGMGGHMTDTYDNNPAAEIAYQNMVKNAAPTLINSGAVDNNTAIKSSLQTGISTGAMATGTQN